MTTAIVGVGHIGSTVARLLVAGGESVILAAKGTERPQALASELGPLARAASVKDAISGADTVVLAVTFSTAQELVPQYAHLLTSKVVIDPTNPIAFDEKGQMSRLLPDGQSAGQVVAGLLPPGAHYVKAFGSFLAQALADGANREPKQAALIYAADGDAAAKTAEQLIRTAGYEPVRAGGVAAAGRLEAGGDLQFKGEPVDPDRARAALN
jgi:8-hydroxy-5-deazaflavin:NADPH oxidoreductase